MVNKLKIIQQIILLIVIISVLLSGYFFYQIKQNIFILEQVTHDNHKIFNLINELRQSSDNLTISARNFVVTNDKIYKQKYLNTLKARNEGKSPKNKNLTLLQRIKNTNINKKALSKFQLAQNVSNDLANIELKAMDISSGKSTIKKKLRKKTATALLYGKSYHEKRKQIQTAIEECMTLLKTSTNTKTKLINDKLHFLQSIFTATLILDAFFGLLLIWLAFRKTKEANNNLQKELYYDSLTKLKNRKSLIEDVKKEESKAVFLVDIQSFSEINDLHGERIGDILLKKFAHYLEATIKKYSSETYRLYGNTFAIINSNNRTKNSYIQITRKLIQKLETHEFQHIEKGVPIDFLIHIKIGIAMSSNSENMLENADMALNYAKKTNQDFAFYHQSLNIEKSYKKYMQTLQMVQKALSEDRIVPYFQPIHRENSITYESLMRLVSEDGTVLEPCHFLEIAKKTRLYFKLTERIIEKTFQIFQNLPYKFSINLSYLDIKNDDTIKHLKDMINKYDISNQLIVEILESDIFEKYDEVINFLQALRKLNIKIAVDDFGSGYSNFSHLMKINPDFIKIDGSLIENIDKDKKSFAVVEAIVRFAKQMNIQTIAEFIHSEEVYEIAKSLNINGYQGYLLSKPKAYSKLFVQDVVYGLE